MFADKSLTAAVARRFGLARSAAMGATASVVVAYCRRMAEDSAAPVTDATRRWVRDRFEADMGQSAAMAEKLERAAFKAAKDGAFKGVILRRDVEADIDAVAVAMKAAYGSVSYFALGRNVAQQEAAKAEAAKAKAEAAAPVAAAKAAQADAAKVQAEAAAKVAEVERKAQEAAQEAAAAKAKAQEAEAKVEATRAMAQDAEAATKAAEARAEQAEAKARKAEAARLTEATLTEVLAHLPREVALAPVVAFLDTLPAEVLRLIRDRVDASIAVKEADALTAAAEAEAAKVEEAAAEVAERAMAHVEAQEAAVAKARKAKRPVLKLKAAKAEAPAEVADAA